MKILVAVTGASGAIYAQRLLDNLDSRSHEVHVVLSQRAPEVMATELAGGLRGAEGVRIHDRLDLHAAFASGSNPPDAMVVVPCSMGTLARIAHGLSDDLILRAADVVLKEKRKLILVPRETPLNLVHLKNMELLLNAGAVLLPANPSFYSRPASVQAIVDTVVARIMDHLGIPQTLVSRWGAEEE
jgi:4-hydroxy-3-polyprenylbenzoate decarboxylase